MQAQPQSVISSHAAPRPAQNESPNHYNVSLTGWQSFLLNLLAFSSFISMALLAAIVAFVARIAFAVHTPNDGGGATYNWMRVGQVSEG
jgi:hypothetical protein